VPLSQCLSGPADRYHTGSAMEDHNTKTTTWTDNELGRIESARELEMAPRRRDGTLRKPVPIVGRPRRCRPSTSAPPTGPAAAGIASRRRGARARSGAGGVEKDVTIEDADDAVNDEVDAAYRAKYRRYAGGIVDGITNTQARSTTLKLVPHT
jgi:hypothetical protein